MASISGDVAGNARNDFRVGAGTAGSPFIVMSGNVRLSPALFAFAVVVAVAFAVLVCHPRRGPAFAFAFAVAVVVASAVAVAVASRYPKVSALGLSNAPEKGDFSPYGIPTTPQTHINKPAFPHFFPLVTHQKPPTTHRNRSRTSVRTRYKKNTSENNPCTRKNPACRREKINK
ncbi:hypothetical protein EDE15_2775 [Edaphobacter aggregans]|jgi:hypothetical protein|uniref:Uncharacterized protein n=1 Tax=Edaphobacter aggregans TaxID=570835 RepID=A0A3R9QBG7_9BACT|nr:hypothetical protein EDE15_2775 [Edaphobacter aggregans]